MKNSDLGQPEIYVSYLMYGEVPRVFKRGEEGCYSLDENGNRLLVSGGSRYAYPAHRFEFEMEGMQEMRTNPLSLPEEITRKVKALVNKLETDYVTIMAYNMQNIANSKGWTYVFSCFFVGCNDQKTCWKPEMLQS